MKKVIAVKANEDFSLELKFNDNSIRKFDARPYLDFRGIHGAQRHRLFQTSANRFRNRPMAA